MTVRGGGVPIAPLAFMPGNRMGPPPRSFAADAHECIMVRVLDPPDTRSWRDWSAPGKRAPLGSSSPIASSVPSCSMLSRRGLPRSVRAVGLERRPALTASARAGLCNAAGRGEETGSQVEQRNEEKRCAALRPLDKKSPIQGGVRCSRSCPASDHLWIRWRRQGRFAVGRHDAKANGSVPLGAPAARAGRSRAREP